MLGHQQPAVRFYFTFDLRFYFSPSRGTLCLPFASIVSAVQESGRLLIICRASSIAPGCATFSLPPSTVAATAFAASRAALCRCSFSSFSAWSSASCLPSRPPSAAGEEGVLLWLRRAQTSVPRLRFACLLSRLAAFQRGLLFGAGLILRSPSCLSFVYKCVFGTKLSSRLVCYATAALLLDWPLAVRFCALPFWRPSVSRCSASCLGATSAGVGGRGGGGMAEDELSSLAPLSGCPCQMRFVFAVPVPFGVGSVISCPCLSQSIAELAPLVRGGV